MKIFITFFLLILLSSISYAKEIADIDFNESINIAGIEKPLQLNGLGIRKKFFFKIYIAALYVIDKSGDAQEIIQHQGAKRMLMHILYDEVTKKKLVDGWTSGFKKNLSSSEYQALSVKIERFNSLFETVKSGDIILLDFLPEQGTQVTIKGVQKGIIKGKAFNQALLKIWLGENPVTNDLKEALLDQ